MPGESADCIVTSPPYWAKRDYGIRGQYGHEPAPASYVETLRAVFREARRVLASDGTCWLNLGDSYSAGSASATGLHAYLGPGLAGRQAPGMGAKNLLGLPWRVALALQDDGWILRDAIVWHKPNAMPESVRDRLNCRHELIFLLVKSRHYWFDLDPIRIPHATARQSHGLTRRGAETRQRPGAPATRHPGGGNRNATRPSGNRPGGNRATGPHPSKYGPHTRQVVAARRYGTGRCGRAHPNGRNPGDVWSIPTRPYPGPHFAAFPIDIPTRCIKAGCKPGGTVLDPFCGTGTTGLAALALGRHFTGIELNPAFAALAAERLQHAQADTGDGSR
jgi:DNA modification methylase